MLPCKFFLRLKKFSQLTNSKYYIRSSENHQSVILQRHKRDLLNLNKRKNDVIRNQKKKKKLNLVQFDQFIFTHLNVLYFEFIGDIDNRMMER